MLASQMNLNLSLNTLLIIAALLVAGIRHTVHGTQLRECCLSVQPCPCRDRRVLNSALSIPQRQYEWQ